MCVYIVQYYAINLMFNSERVAAFVSGSKGGAASGTGTASPAGLSVPLEHRKKGAACLRLALLLVSTPAHPLVARFHQMLPFPFLARVRPGEQGRTLGKWLSGTGEHLVANGGVALLKRQTGRGIFYRKVYLRTK